MMPGEGRSGVAMSGVRGVAGGVRKALLGAGRNELSDGEVVVLEGRPS